MARIHTLILVKIDSALIHLHLAAETEHKLAHKFDLWLAQHKPELGFMTYPVRRINDWCDKHYIHCSGFYEVIETA